MRYDYVMAYVAQSDGRLFASRGDAIKHDFDNYTMGLAIESQPNITWAARNRSGDVWEAIEWLAGISGYELKDAGILPDDEPIGDAPDTADKF